MVGEHLKARLIFLEPCPVCRDLPFLRTSRPHLLQQQKKGHLLPLSCCLGNQNARRQAVAWPGSERRAVDPGHQSGGAVLPEPVLAPQRHFRRQCWSQQEGSPLPPVPSRRGRRGAALGVTASAVLVSQGWAWSQIMPLCDAAPLWASNSPSVKWAHLPVRTNGEQKIENHIMPKRVEPGCLGPCPYSALQDA